MRPLPVFLFSAFLSLLAHAAALCPDGSEVSRNSTCQNCSAGTYSNADSDRLCVACPSGSYSTAPGAAACVLCRACPDGFYRADCSTSGGGGTCLACVACGAGYVNVGCMNRAGHTDAAGTCRSREHVVRTPLCDEKGSGFGLGGYKFVDLFGVSQNDTSFQCRRRCDNEQNILSSTVYQDPTTYEELRAQFPTQRAFNGGYCSGPHACDVVNCNIAGSADDSQTDYQPRLACPVHIDADLTRAFWAALVTDDGSPVVARVRAMRATQCQTCAACGQQGEAADAVEDWGRGCARDCTQLTCAPGLIFDWTEPVAAAKCKACGDLNDVRLCLSRERNTFDGYDVSGRLPKLYMKDCSPKRQLALRGYELDYGKCMQCPDFEAACVASRDQYYQTCAEVGAQVVSTCRACVRGNGRDPTNSSFWDGAAFRNLYCQQPRCPVSAGLGYTGVNTESAPHRICHRPCQAKTCAGGASTVVLPCMLPHQQRCVDAVNMDLTVVDAKYTAIAHTPAHSNILEPATTDLHLFANFENMLVNTEASSLSQRAQCVWNADFIPDNSASPAGISSRFERNCRSWSRNPRAQYPLMPLQNTVSPGPTGFPRRVLLNTSAQAVAYSEGSVTRPPGVFAGDIYLQLNLTNTNNATLAVFVPDDRGIELAAWVPRWRVYVHVRQLQGGKTALALEVAFEDTCYACFSLKLFLEYGPPANEVTESMTAATGSFRGDKFAFLPSPGLFVCGLEVQRRAHAAFSAMRYDASLSVLFASSLTDACVSKYGVATQSLQSLQPLPTDLLRSSEVFLSGECLIYAFSSSSVYCIRRAGGATALSWSTPRELSQGTLVDLAVHDGLVVRTIYNGQFQQGEISRYVSLLSAVGSASEAVLKVPGLVMFARGAPQYFLRRTADDNLKLSMFEPARNSTFSLNATPGYTQNDVSILFSTFVPISGANTLLEHHGDFVLFATAKYIGEHVYVYAAVFDERLVLLSTYGIQCVVFVLTRGEEPVKITDAYQRIAFAGTPVLSSMWLSPHLILLSVAVEGATTSRFAPLLLNATDLSLATNTLHPDLSRAFDAPFVRMANAVASSGMIKSCSECEAASGRQTRSGFFAYGASPVSYKRLDACKQDNLYIEERITQSMPITSCGQVLKYPPPSPDEDQYRDATLDVTLACVTAKPLEVVLELPVGAQALFTNGARMTAKTAATRLLLSVACTDSIVSDVMLYDATPQCELGCRVNLLDSTFRIQGGVVIESVRHRPLMSRASAFWDRRVLLHTGLPRADYSSKPARNEWQEHSITTRAIVPRQQIHLVAQRDVDVARLAARGFDGDERLALDALAVVPVLSEHFVPAVAGNRSWLRTIMYVPSPADLSILNLTTLYFGDDRADWARVHASVHVTVVSRELQLCSYAVRLVAVDSDFRVVARDAQAAATGCVLNFAQAPQCHIELPVRLANQASVVGVELHALTDGCAPLSEAHDISVELAPFMRISQCPAHHFLDVDRLTCTVCDDGEPFCSAGYFVSGCLPLMHPAVVPECLPCPRPNSSSFPQTALSCEDWECLPGFYRLEQTCARCTALLASGATACSATGGLMRRNCTRLENEKCVDCAPKPRYSEWSASSAFSSASSASECTWHCKDAYFANGASCEKCLTFDEAVAALSVSGQREAGKFYRFEKCSAAKQTRWEACNALDFGYDLEGTYVGDGRALDEDCVLRCAENSNRHSVRINATSMRTGTKFVWRARVCQNCPDSSWPVSANAARLPRAAFEMSTACEATCVDSAGYFAGRSAGTCLFCPPNACPSGAFWSSRDNCTTCQPCARSLHGGEFVGPGAFDAPASCAERCPSDSFAADNRTCQPFSGTSCVEGLEYAIAGTPTSDARCGACADCSFARETAPCLPTRNRQCASCGPVESWSGAWSRTGCELVCHSAQGYTKLYTPDGEVCRKCLVCPVGEERPDRPTDCACAACRAPIPAKATYNAGCMWTCPLYHVARLDTSSGLLQCEYTVRQTSVVVNHLRAASPVLCPAGQRLTADTRPAPHPSLQCENCTTPAGMQAADLGVVWRWDRACAWQCAWNLQKLLALGQYSCEAVRYVHTVKPALQPAPSAGGLQTAHLLGLFAAGIVVVLFGLCFMRRMLADRMEIVNQ